MSISFEITKRSLRDMSNNIGPNTKPRGANGWREIGSLQDHTKNQTVSLLGLRK